MHMYMAFATLSIVMYLLHVERMANTIKSNNYVDFGCIYSLCTVVFLSCTVNSEQSVIVSVEFEDLMNELAAITKPVPLITFHLFLEGLISTQSLAEICSSIEPMELPLEEIKFPAIMTDSHKHSIFIKILKFYFDTTDVAKKLEGIIRTCMCNQEYIHFCVQMQHYMLSWKW